MLKTKNCIKLLLVCFLVIGFSGCLPAPPGGGGAKKKKATPPKGGVYKSIDGGETFEQKKEVKLSGATGEQQVSLVNENILAITFDHKNKERLYAGTPNLGLLKTDNGGDIWIRSKGNFKNVTDIYVDNDNPNLIHILASADGKTRVLRTRDRGENWETLFTQRTVEEKINGFAVDKFNADIMYVGDAKGGVHKSIDAGRTWKNILWAKSGIKKIMMDNIDTNLLYFITIQSGVFRSDNAGASFVDLKTEGIILGFVPHPTKKGVVFLSDNNGLQRSFDRGASFRPLHTLIRPKEMGSQGFTADPVDGNVMYFVSGNTFYKTMNGGESWRPVQIEIDRIIRSVIVNPLNPKIVYLGTVKPPPPKKKKKGFLPF